MSQQSVVAAQHAVLAGAGELAGELVNGTTAFALAWEVAFRTMSDGAALVANNIGRASLDLQATDVSCSGVPQL